MNKVLVVILFLVSSAYASESSVYDFNWLDTDKEVYVLQNRKFRKDSNLYLSAVAGMTTSGAFVDSYSYQGRIGYFFKEEYGVELLFAKNSSSKNETYENLQAATNSDTFYRKVGNPLDTAVIFHYMDSVSSLLNQTNAIGRNFTQYPIWGTPLVNEPTPMATNHLQEVTNMKNFIKARIAWLDNKWITTNPSCPAPEGLDEVKYASLFSIYPNPASSQIYVSMDDANTVNYTAELISMQGAVLQTQQGRVQQFSVGIQHIPAGMYMLRVKTSAGTACKRIIKE